MGEPSEPEVTQVLQNTGRDATTPSSSRETRSILGALMAVIILLIIFAVFAIIIRKRRILALKSKAEFFSTSGSGGSETNTWKYTTGHPSRSDTSHVTSHSSQCHSRSDSSNIYAEIDHTFQPTATNVSTHLTSTKPTNQYLLSQPTGYQHALAHSTPQKREPQMPNRPVTPLYKDLYTQSLKYPARLQRPAATYHSPNQLNNSHFY